MNPFESYLYIASGAADGGIYAYKMTSDGRTEPLAEYPLGKTMYLAVQGNRLYALAAVSADNNGWLFSFSIEEDGRLRRTGEALPTRGKEACHLWPDGDMVYCVNYDSAGIIRMPDRLVTHTGRSVHPERQSDPHPHYICVTPDGNYCCAVDLGLDKILVYDKALHPVSEVNAPAGYGPRHLVFSQDGRTAFCTNELISSVSVYAYDNGHLSLLRTVSTLPEDYTGESYAAAIRLSSDGRFLFVSNRGHDSICCFEVDGTSLTRRSISPCGGHWPRDFILTDSLLICTNELSGTVTFFCREGCILTPLTENLSIPTAQAALAVQA